MKTLLLSLLAVSVFGNVALGLYSLRHSPKLATATSGLSAGSSSASASNSGATVESIAAQAAATAGAAGKSAGAPAWSGVRTDADMRKVVDSLRAAGYPPSILRAVVGQMLRERAERLNPAEDRPFWKRAGRSTPEEVAAQLALTKESNALREELLGAEGAPAAMLSATERARRFGNMSDDKINALLKLDQEYNEVRAVASAGEQTGNGRDRAEARRALEAEKRADLEAVLSPAELEQYDMRNSDTAQRVQSAIRNVDVTEAEYAQLYAIQKAQDALNPNGKREFNGAEGMVNRVVSQTEINEQARAILGDDRFFKYLESADQGYAAAARFATQQNIPQAQAYQIYQLQNEFMVTMASARGTQGGPPTAERIAEIRAMAQNYEARLQNLIGAEATEAYKKDGPGRMLGSVMSGLNGRRANRTGNGGPGGN